MGPTWWVLPPAKFNSSLLNSYLPKGKDRLPVPSIFSCAINYERVIYCSILTCSFQTIFYWTLIRCLFLWHFQHERTLFYHRPTFLLNPSGGWWIHGQWELAGICCETKALAIRRPSSSFAMVRRREPFPFQHWSVLKPPGREISAGG